MAGRRSRSALIAFAALASATAACGSDERAFEGAGGAALERALLHQSESAAAPPPDDPGWREVALTDYWGLRRRSARLAGWYRVEIARPETTEPWAAALEGEWDALAIELDGRRVLDAGALPGHLGDRRSGVLVPLPTDAGTHTLVVRFQTAAWRIGYLEPLLVGPSHAVLARRERAATLQPVLRTSLTALAGGCGLLLWLLRRWDATHAARWFAAGSLVWCAGFLQAWPRLADFGYGFVPALFVHAFPLLFAIGLRRRLLIRGTAIELLLVAATLLPAALRVAIPPLYVPFVDGLWWIVSLAVGFYLLGLVGVAVRRGSIDRSAVLMAGTLAILAAGIHDLGSVFVGRPPAGVFLFQFAPGVLVICVSAALLASLGTRLGEAERLNVELEDRVEARRKELAQSYARMAVLEKDRAIAAERERLMRDMHDGTGGALVSAIAMAESGTAAPAAVAEVLRDALADLRLSIDSLDPSEPDLVALLGATRARFEPRIEGGKVRIAWEVRDVPAPAGFGPESALQVLRIFQEAVGNAIRHADARTVTVRTAEERDPDGRAWIAIEVADDGRGFDPDGGARSQGGGRGLGNMRRRAAELGGELAVVSGPQGSRVRLRLPAVPAATPAS